MILSWNRGAEEIYGYRAQEVVGQPISLLVPPELSDGLHWNRFSAMDTYRDPGNLVLRYRTKGMSRFVRRMYS
jgi:PAS domain S-box-containing protein